MTSFVKALSLAVALSAVSAVEAHAQFIPGRIPGGSRSSSTGGSRTSPSAVYGSASVSRQLQPYLDGVSLSRAQEVSVERAWESGGTTDQRLDAVRQYLTTTQRHRFDQNRAALAYDAGYQDGRGTNGGYGQGGYGQGTYDQRSRSGRYDGQRQRGDDDGDRGDGRSARGDRQGRRGDSRARSQQGQQRGNSAAHRKDGGHRKDGRDGR